MSLLIQNVFSLEGFPFPEVFERAENIWSIIDEYKLFATSYQFKGINGTVESGAFFRNPQQIEIEEGAYIESGSYIAGPCFIGAGTVIRHGAYLRGGVFVGRNCVIGHCTELKDVCFAEGVKAAHFAYVGNSVLASHVNLGAGVKCANFRLDGKEVALCDGNSRVATGKRKVGSFIGENASIGCNTVLNPGSVVAANVQIFPGTVVSGIVNE